MFMPMTRLAAPLLALSLLAPPAVAQEGYATNMIEDGLKLFFRGLVQEMEPALEDLEALARDMGPAMADFLREMGPALKDLMDEVKDWSAYHPPEMLPNGDIILRRKTPLSPEAQPENEIEL